jgi:hypothetical protein
MECLLRASLSLWQLLALLAPHQLQALSSSQAFYQLPLAEAPAEPLPHSLLGALLEVSCVGLGCS